MSKKEVNHAIHSYIPSRGWYTRRITIRRGCKYLPPRLTRPGLEFPGEKAFAPRRIGARNKKTAAPADRELLWKGKHSLGIHLYMYIRCVAKPVVFALRRKIVHREVGLGFVTAV